MKAMRWRQLGWAGFVILVAFHTVAHRGLDGSLSIIPLMLLMTAVLIGGVEFWEGK